MTDIITATDKLACAERELKMRKRVYSRWVAEEKMSAGKAAHELACMEAIVADYRSMIELQQHWPPERKHLFDAKQKAR